jgi:RNA polymerase sigma factor (sigma-70 family)
LTETQHIRFEEERHMIEKCQQHDEASMEQMILRYMPYIKKIASRYTHLIPFDDLVQEGMMGLVEGLMHYDASKGILFSTYATSWIKKNMLRAMDDTAHLIRVPVYITNLRNKIKKILRNEPSASQERLATLTGVPINQIDYAKQPTHTSELIEDVMSDHHNPHEAYVLSIMEETYDRILETLTDIEHFILVHRYEDNKMSYQAISEQLKLPIRHIKKHEATMKHKLQLAYYQLQNQT